jgi:hypothetical protein
MESASIGPDRRFGRIDWMRSKDGSIDGLIGSIDGINRTSDSVRRIDSDWVPAMEADRNDTIGLIGWYQSND